MASQAWMNYLKSSNIDPTTAEPTQQQLQPLQQPNYGTLGALAGLYGTYAQGNQVGNAYGAAATGAQSQADLIQKQMAAMPTLDSLYGQNSPYSQQLQQTLAAKDAAAGRNSQYGQRAVQLQAALADKASQYGSAQAQMMSQYNQALQQANAARTQATIGQQQVGGQQLGSLFNLANQTGLLGAANSGINSGLQSLFGGLGTPSSSGAVNQPLDQSVYGGSPSSAYAGYTTGSPTDVPSSSVPMDQSPYSNYGGNYQSYTPGTSGTPQGLDTTPYNTNVPQASDGWLDTQ